MMKLFYVWTACATVALGPGLAQGLEKEAVRPNVVGWLDSALADKQVTVPEEGDELARDVVQAQEDFLWRAYRDAARRAGWDKELLGVSTTVETMIKNGGQLEIKAGQLKSDDKSISYALMAKGETSW
jgi:hypothetical protein